MLIAANSYMVAGGKENYRAARRDGIKHKMKAISVSEFGPPSVLRMVDTAPPDPRADELVIRVCAAGVNPLETYLRAGTPIGNYLPALPYRPGSEAAGIVVSAGHAVEDFAPGDRVFGQVRSGSYAEFAAMRANAALRLPANLTFAQGSAISGPYRAACLSLLHLAQAEAGETVLIHGASGSVGTAAIQFARARGLIVIGTASSEQGRARVLAEGANFAVNHREDDALQQAVAWNGGRGMDVILEMNAAANLGRDLTAMAGNGRIVIIGGQGNVSIDPVAIIGAGIRIHGLSIPLTPPAALQQTNAAIQAGVNDGTLRPAAPVEIPLPEAFRAHEALSAHSGRDRYALIP